MSGGETVKEIKLLSEFIDEEMEDAEKYAKIALECKEKDRSAANMFADLASQELNHAHMLHQQAVRLIEAKKGKGEEHKKQIDHKARIKMMLSMYQES